MATISPKSSKDKLHIVYELIDPRDNLPFYVGITDDMYRRFKEHMRCNGVNLAKDRRIQEIIKDHEMVIMRSLAKSSSYHKGLALELEWINKYIGQGIKLLNIADVLDEYDPGYIGVDRRKFKDVSDLLCLVFSFNGTEVLNVYDATPSEMDRLANMYCNISNIDVSIWPMRERLRMVNHLWDFCQEKGYTFPLRIKSKG